MAVENDSCQNCCDYHKLILMGSANDIMRELTGRWMAAAARVVVLLCCLGIANGII